MERWGVSPPEPPRRVQPAPTAGDAAISQPVPKRGFGASFRSLVSRKLRELTGRRWAGASERAREAEAARRGAAEMARRIERETGRRPSDATIRRAAREDRTPRGADQERMDRQARIDQAGSIAALARQAGATKAAVTKWRDSGGALVAGACLVTAEVDGVLWVNGEPYPRSMTVSVIVGPPAADEIRAAYAVLDFDAIAELLGPAISEQVDWAGDAERNYEVESISNVTVT